MVFDALNGCWIETICRKYREKKGEISFGETSRSIDVARNRDEIAINVNLRELAALELIQVTLATFAGLCITAVYIYQMILRACIKKFKKSI